VTADCADNSDEARIIGVFSECSNGTIVVVFTSSDDIRDIDAAYALGANAYLMKPADAGKLTAIAQLLKDFWLTHNRRGSAFA
jgi:DNA-binding NarL/FixJ family response regulator